jgi:DNA-directed RNA polymerase
VFKDLDMGANLKHRNLQAWMWDWHVKTEPHLQQCLEDLASQEMQRASKVRTTPMTSFLKLLPPSKLVLIATLELLNMLASSGYSDGARTTRVVLTIGAAIEAEHHFQVAKKQDIPTLEFKNKSELPTYSVQGYLELHKERVKAKLELEGRENWMPPWTQEIRARVGAFVLDALMEKATVVQSKTIDGTL